MIYFMDITQHGINIQHREYDRACPCVDAMLVAREYYLKKNQAVEIIMTNEQKIIIAQIEVKQYLKLES